jgi:hypothetical protein
MTNFEEALGEVLFRRLFRNGTGDAGNTPGTGVVLGEPGFDLGERGSRDRFGARPGESLFSRQSGYTNLRLSPH